MTKAELIERVSKDLGPGVTKRLVQDAIESAFVHMQKGIKRDKRFSYPGFGSWQVTRRKARTGRNPKTGEAIKIPPTRTVIFKPSPAFKDNL